MWSKKELEEMKNNGAIFLADREPASFTKLPDLKIEISGDDKIEEIVDYIREQKNKAIIKKQKREERKKKLDVVLSTFLIAILMLSFLVVCTAFVVLSFMGKAYLSGTQIPPAIAIVLVSAVWIPICFSIGYFITKVLKEGDDNDYRI